MTKKIARKKSSPTELSKRVTKKDAEKALNEGAKKITPADVEHVIGKAEKIEKKFSRGGPLGQFLSDFKDLISVVRDYWSGEYRAIPYWSIAAIVFALLYVLNPLDLIPDFIPLVGYVDDALVVGVCMVMVRQDLHNYREWRRWRGDAVGPVSARTPAPPRTSRG